MLTKFVSTLKQKIIKLFSYERSWTQIQGVTISKICTHYDSEYIELTNNSLYPINISNWTLSVLDKIDAYTFSQGTLLLPYQSLRVYSLPHHNELSFNLNYHLFENEISVVILLDNTHRFITCFSAQDNLS